MGGGELTELRRMTTDHANQIDDLRRTVSNFPVRLHRGGGASLPAPTKKYQVYTPIDDTLQPIWTTLRFCDG